MIIALSITQFFAALLFFALFSTVLSVRIREGSPNISVGLNSSLELLCGNANQSLIAIGHGWNNDEQMACFVDSNNEFKLLIENIHSKHEGNYTCENSNGNIITRFRVFISKSKEKPKNAISNGIQQKMELDACEKDENKMRIWKKDGKAICAQKSAEEACALDLFIGIPNKTASKRQLSHLLAPILTALMAILLVILLIIGFMYMRRRNKELKNLRMLHAELVEQAKTKYEISSARPLHEQIDQLPFDMSYEIRLHRLTIKKVISRGEYGRVYAGELRAKGLSKQYMEVAIKGPKRAAKYADIEALLEELKMMIAVGVHPNVLCLIGTVTENMKRGGDLYGIVEYTMCDMKTFLSKRKAHFVDENENLQVVTQKSNNIISSNTTKLYSKGSTRSKKDPEDNVSTSLLISFAYQIANGMEYLASKMCVHRDLAARNILVRKNRLIRIADFGQDRQWDYQYLVKSIQYASPFKAMARESISDSSFSEKSDVWSYGVLLWELFTLGDDPFKEFETAEKLKCFYETGGRLTIPAYMPDNMSTIMSHCWLEDPNDRPTFSKCKKMTESVLRVRNPQLLLTTHKQLMEELLAMRKYAEWRDGPPHARVQTDTEQQSK